MNKINLRRTVHDNKIVKKYIDSGKDYSTIASLKIKIRFLRQKQKRIKISEMS